MRHSQQEAKQKSFLGEYHNTVMRVQLFLSISLMSMEGKNGKLLKTDEEIQLEKSAMWL